MNIGQVSKATGVSLRMIRHYEGIGLMPLPDRRDNGYRDYPPPSVERLRFIANARDLGFSVEEISALLSLWDDRTRASSCTQVCNQRQESIELTVKFATAMEIQ